MPITRKTSEATKKIVAARQKWCCGACSMLLPSCFEVDHSTPLWDGGADDESNLRALCPNCHAQKTQLEAVARAKRRQEAADRARADHARQLRERVTEEVQNYAIRALGNGRQHCRMCGRKTASFFPHRCALIQARIQEKLGDGPKARVGEAANPFARFICGT